METIRYSRETAVNEGLRTTSEINKGFYKRPVIRMLKKNTLVVDIPKYKEYAHDFAMKYILTVPSKINQGRVEVSAYMNADKKKSNLYNSWSEKKSFISIKDLRDLDHFNNKVVNVYVEKQHGNIYTLRSLIVIPDVVEVNLGGFYDIAGKAVVLNISKKKGNYKVNNILNLIED